MPNPTITDYEMGGWLIRNEESENDTLAVAGAGTLPAGTILARSSVNQKLIPFVVGGGSGAGEPKGVLIHDVEATGAGDYPVSMLTVGTVWADRLIINADGDASNVDVEVKDGLRAYGIIAKSATELNTPDNS